MDAIEIIKVIIWPLTVIILFIVFRTPIINLLNRTTKIGIGNRSIETSTENQITKQLEESTIPKIERALGIFRDETIELFNEAVIEESEVEKIKLDSEKVERLKKYATVLYILLRFDSIYSIIFGSQLHLLQKVNSLRKQNKESLKYIFDEAKKHWPKELDHFTYDDFLGYLLDSNLINEEKGEINLTILGVDFLKYLIETNKEIVDKPY